MVCIIVDVTPNNTYTDSIGRFSYRSSRVNEYIFAGYHYDGNDILAEPLKNRTVEVITQ